MRYKITISALACFSYAKAPDAAHKCGPQTRIKAHHISCDQVGPPELFPTALESDKEECIIDYRQIPPTFEASFDECDMQEIRRREKADQAIIARLDGVLFC
jgi:hypothetical protein